VAGGNPQGGLEVEAILPRMARAERSRVAFLGESPAPSDAADRLGSEGHPPLNRCRDHAGEDWLGLGPPIRRGTLGVVTVIAQASPGEQASHIRVDRCQNVGDVRGVERREALEPHLVPPRARMCRWTFNWPRARSAAR